MQSIFFILLHKVGSWWVNGPRCLNSLQNIQLHSFVAAFNPSIQYLSHSLELWLLLFPSADKPWNAFWGVNNDSSPQSLDFIRIHHNRYLETHRVNLETALVRQTTPLVPPEVPQPGSSGAGVMASHCPAHVGAPLLFVSSLKCIVQNTKKRLPSHR